MASVERLQTPDRVISYRPGWFALVLQSLDMLVEPTFHRMRGWNDAESDAGIVEAGPCSFLFDFFLRFSLLNFCIQFGF